MFGNTKKNRTILLKKRLKNKTMKTIDLNYYSKIPFYGIFATGIEKNDDSGIPLYNIDNDKDICWVAIKEFNGGWIIRCDLATHTAQWVAEHGIKITRDKYIRKCVQCTDDVFLLYNKYSIEG